jgi:hypothetical protein
VEFVDLDGDYLGDGDGWAEVAGGTVHMDSNGGGGANKKEPYNPA